MAGLILRSRLLIGTAAIMVGAGAAPAVAQRMMPPQVTPPPARTRQQHQMRTGSQTLMNPSLLRQLANSSAYQSSYSAPYMPMMANPYETSSTMKYGNQESYGKKSYDSESAKDNANKEAETTLTALGLPVKNGHLDWPIALDALPGEESRNLRQQLESLLLVMARGSQSTKGNAGLAEEAKRALDRLDSLAYSNRYSMTLGTRKDAGEFLDKLENALSLLQQIDYRAKEGRQKETSSQTKY